MNEANIAVIGNYDVVK